MESLQLDLERALERLKANSFDEAGWSGLYHTLAARANAIAFRLIGEPSAAQDAVQEAFVRLLRRGAFQRFASGSDLSRYFWTVVRNAAIDALRSKRGEIVTENSADVMRAEDGDEDPNLRLLEALADPSASADSGPEMRSTVQYLERHLSKREMLVSTMLIDGYSLSEVASRLGVTNATAAVIVHRLRNKIRHLVDGQASEPT